GEVALEQVGGDPLCMARICGPAKTPRRVAPKAEIPHDSRDALLARTRSTSAQSAADARCAVPAPVLVEHLLDLGSEGDVVNGTLAGLSVQPLVVAAAR